MLRRFLPSLALAACLVLFAWHSFAQKQHSEMNWIWFDEGNPLSEAPAETRYFRRAFMVEKMADNASLEITADNRFTVWLNGQRIGGGDKWETLHNFDVKKHLKMGKNALAVETKNDGGPAGLVVRLVYTAGKEKTVVASDGTWKSVKVEPGKGWQNIDFDDAKWGKAKVLGAYGKVGPWAAGGGGTPGTPPIRKFTVPPGYRVEEIVKRPDDRGVFSLVNMCFDSKGRLFVSHESGGVLLCTRPDEKGVLQEVRDYCTQVKNCHGMCWVKDAFYLVGNGPKGTGLYRCRDTKQADAIDEVTLIHRFQGNMEEHGPHGVVHGPDGKLYVVVGNHAFVRIGAKQEPNPETIAPNSPLLRWPTGGQGPDQGKPGSTEDVLLPRLNDANGHAANIRAPGGTIWRIDPDGKNVALVAAGFRNHFDAAFSPEGELFSFDSDMEWDEGMPWYRAVRAIHCPPGADFVWRTGAANTQSYYLDSLPPLADTGRGSPVGVTCCTDDRFGSKYRGASFMADWSIGVIYAVPLKRKGATYEGTPERFCIGSPMPVTDLEFAPDGSLVFTVGGRGSQGGVYRVVPPKDSPVEARPVDQSLVRAHDVWKMGVSGDVKHKDALVKALTDADAFVRRRACEALIRASIEPDANDIWPLLADEDHFVCTAARLVLQRIDPVKWIDRLGKEKNDLAAYHAIIALCKTGQAERFADGIFSRLKASEPKSTKALLDFARTLQLACFHVPAPPATVKELAGRCEKVFGHEDAFVNREFAILLTHFRRTKVIDSNVQGMLLKAMQSSTDRPQQIHYFYCLRLLSEGWTKEQQADLVAWYEKTQPWNGGASFKGFLANILRDCLAAFSDEEKKGLLAKYEKSPMTTLAIIRAQQVERKPELLPAMKELARKIESPKLGELRKAVEEAIVLTVCDHPKSGDYADLVGWLSSSSKVTTFNAASALRKLDAKPKAEDAKIYRTAIEAASNLDAGNRWQIVLLLRHWSGGRQFGHDQKATAKELAAWVKWYGQAFPKEPALAEAIDESATPSKYKFDDLLAMLTTGEGKSGNVAAGKKVFEKASCLKCHKYGKDGEGLGPDLSTVSKRFKRAEILESIYQPSKVISDQYRSTTIVTEKGQRFEGLVAVQGDVVTVLQADGNKATLRKKDIDKQFASLISVMPEKLMDPLTKQEIADLFAFMESEPEK